MCARATSDDAALLTMPAGTGHSDEVLPDIDEPPDDPRPRTLTRSNPSLQSIKMQSISAPPARRESLLTRQLHSEVEHTDDEATRAAHPPRTFSTHSTWSNASTTSTAELTSDDGHSVASPSMSPPFLASAPLRALPVAVKPLDPKIKIVGQEDAGVDKSAQPANPESAVEAGLGRKRCITFACRGKQDTPRAPTPEPQVQETAPEPQKKKCSLKFVCPSRPSLEVADADKATPKRAVSPPPASRRTPAGTKGHSRAHRGSDSTIHASPKSLRKNPSFVANTPTAATAAAELASRRPLRQYSSDSGESDHEKEALRFHEFATSEDEPEDWVQESTCHRSRLTVNDTLKKENVIRKACEEVEEEAVEEDEEAEHDLDAGLNDDNDDVDDEGDDDGDDQSDDGFDSDDEHGFANSDSEGDDDSDVEWWRPGGVSTAATSVEHLDRLAIVNSQHPPHASSVESASSGRVSPGAHSRSHRRRKHGHTAAMPIHRSVTPEPDLPDSTDFVCGTLDEDRPLEQAYLNRRKIREAAKHPTRPQDIDPTFPTSDPEMDEEDEEDLVESAGSDQDVFLQGELEDTHDKGIARKTSLRGRHRSVSHRSPPPPAAHQRYHSPAPKKKGVCRSPPPRDRTRSNARSPAPRMLFGHSPRRMRSPAPTRRMPSPRNSPTGRDGDSALDEETFRPRLAIQLAQRPQLTRTASLPRRSGAGRFTLSKLGGRLHHEDVRDEEEDDGEASDSTVGAPTTLPPKRGAIDIVKGLDRKRQHRRDKLYQKHCAAKAAAAAKNGGAAGAGAGCPSKKKAGRGAERMRAIGLQLQNYHGRAEHILSL